MRAWMAAAWCAMAVVWADSAFAQTCTLATSTTTVVTSSVNPSAFGQPVQFSARINNSGATYPCTPTGIVTFYDGSAPLGTVTVSGGSARITVSTLSTGTHTIYANYGGDTYNPPSVGSVSQAVDKQPYPASDSGRLRDVQTVGSKNAAIISGTVIVSAIEGAISDAFGTIPNGAGAGRDGTSNTIIIGESPPAGGGSGRPPLSTIQDGTSNTILQGEGQRPPAGNGSGRSPPSTIQDGTSNTILQGEGQRPPAGGGSGGTPPGTVQDGTSNTIIQGEGQRPPAGGGSRGTPPGTVQDGTSNTILQGEGQRPPAGGGSGGTQPGTTQDGTSNTILQGEPRSGDGSNSTTGPMRYVAEPPRSRRVEEAFNALAHAAGGRRSVRTVAPPREWRAWLDVRGSGWDQNNAAGDQSSTQINVTGGVSRRLSDSIVVGAVVGFENFNSRISSLAGELSGTGGTVGGYFGWRFAGQLRFDAALTWSGIAYSAEAGTATGSFTGSRWLASTGLSAEHRYGAFVVEPSARLFVLWERQGAWTDSVGGQHDDRSFSTGRASAGAKFSYLFASNGNLLFTPFAGFYGDYRFSTDDALPVAPTLVGIEDGLSARVTAGAALAVRNSGSLTLGGELGNLGASGPTLWSVFARGALPF